MRHDAQAIKENMTLDNIRSLLFELGADHVPDSVNNRGELITNTICHNQSGGSHKLYYSESYKGFRCYTGCSESFDIYELVRKVYEQRGTDLQFGAIVNWVAEKTGNSFGFGGGGFNSSVKINEELEWMQRFSRKRVELSEPEYHDDRIMDVFSPHANHPEFSEDGISSKSMDRFGIKYYNKDNSLIIPHRHWKNGNLIGLMSRTLDEMTIQQGYKYIPSTVQGKQYNHIKSQNIYGLYENLEAIKRLKKIIVFEAEKSVMQTYTYFGENCYAVALSGSNMSQQQVDIILDIDEIVEIQFAMDKEFKDGDEIAEKIQMQKVLNIGRKFSPYVKVTVLWDVDNLLDYKDSPSDKGLDVLLELLKNKQEILNLD